MNRTLVLAAAASAALFAAPLAAVAQDVTSTTVVATNGAGQPVAEANVTASQPVANPPPATTERGPGNADTGYNGQLQGTAFRDVYERITADEQKMGGNRHAMTQLRAIKAEADQRRARHGGELRDWDRELINKKLGMVEGAGADDPASVSTPPGGSEDVAGGVSDPPDEPPVLRAIAMPADTNPEGDIFGGWLMSQMDLAASTIAFGLARGRCATVAVERVTFLGPVFVGDEVSVHARPLRVGRTSVRVEVEAWRRRRDGGASRRVATGEITYVAIDENRRARPLDTPGPPPADPGG